MGALNRCLKRDGRRLLRVLGCWLTRAGARTLLALRGGCPGERRNAGGMGSRPNIQVRCYSAIRLERRKRNKRVRLRVDWPTARHLGHIQPHRRGCSISVTLRSFAHRGSSVPGPVALMPAPLVGCWVLAHLGRTWLQEHAERSASRKWPKKVHRISDDFR
jgi:hypothetical protein